MRLENIHENINNGSKRSLSKEQLLKFFGNEGRTIDENTKYHVNDEFYFNADKDIIWTIDRVIGKFNVEGIIEPQMYEISSPIRGASWNVVYKTVTEQDLDTKYTQIDADEPEWGGEITESFLKEEKAEVNDEDKKILNQGFFKIGEHYSFWPESETPLFFYIDDMYLNSKDLRVFCHIVYEDMPGKPLGTIYNSKKRYVTNTHSSLNGLEEMRQKGDVRHEEIEDPDSDGSDWDD